MKKNINTIAVILAAFTLMLFGGIPAFAQGPGPGSNGHRGYAPGSHGGQTTFQQPAAPRQAAPAPAMRAADARPHHPAPPPAPAPVMRGQAPRPHHHPAPPPAYRPAPPPEPRPHGGLIQMILHSLVDSL